MMGKSQSDCLFGIILLKSPYMIFIEEKASEDVNKT